MDVHDGAIGEMLGTLDKQEWPRDVRDGLVTLRRQFHNWKPSVPSPCPLPRGEGNMEYPLARNGGLYGLLTESRGQFLQPPGDVLVELVFWHVFHAGDLLDRLQVDDFVQEHSLFQCRR